MWPVQVSLKYGIFKDFFFLTPLEKPNSISPPNFPPNFRIVYLNLCSILKRCSQVWTLESLSRRGEQRSAGCQQCTLEKELADLSCCTPAISKSSVDLSDSRRAIIYYSMAQLALQRASGYLMQMFPNEMNGKYQQALSNCS